MKLISKNPLLILGFIILIAFILRFWQLGSVPPSPDWDEAAHGYNAYSLLLTGKDEYGKFLPIVLQSFNDYKPALYIYMVIPFIMLFDVSLFAVRLPSAIAGTLAVIVCYYFIKELFSLGATKAKFIQTLALLTAFFLAISPWHIQFSRIGFESNVSLTCTMLFYLFFLKGLRKHSYLIPAAIFAGLTLYLYQSAKVFTPLIVLAYGVIFLKEILKIQKKWLVSAIIAGLLVVIPMGVYILTNPDALIRARGVSIFHQDTTQFLTQSANRLNVDKQNGDFVGLVFDNRRVDFTKLLVSNYLSHYNPLWLFLRGDSIRHHAPHMGILYIFEIPLLLFGIYTLVTGTFHWKIKAAIFAQFFLAAVPSAITLDVPSAVRVLTVMPVYPLFSALGLLSLIQFIRSLQVPYITLPLQRIGKGILFIFLGGFALYNFVYYLNQYFVQQNYFQSQGWQYGWKEAVSYIEANRTSYDKIIVTNKEPLDQSYMFYLYFTKFDPVAYQAIGGSKDGEFKATHEIQNIEFRPIDWSKEEKSDRIMYVGRRKDIPSDVKPLKVIHYLDGTEAIIIVKGR